MDSRRSFLEHEASPRGYINAPGAQGFNLCRIYLATMRSSLLGLQLLLAGVLLWGTSVMAKQRMAFLEDSTSEELEERGKEYRERMQRHSGSHYETLLFKRRALDYFHKHRHDAVYRFIEDMDIKAQKAVGTLLFFTHFLVNTNCSKEQGREFSDPWYEPRHSTVAPCVPVPKHEQKVLKCRVYMFIDAPRGRSVVLRQDCEPVVFWEGSEDTLDLNHLLDFSIGRLKHSF